MFCSNLVNFFSPQPEVSTEALKEELAQAQSKSQILDHVTEQLNKVILLLRENGLRLLRAIKLRSLFLFCQSDSLVFFCVWNECDAIEIDSRSR